MQPYNKLNLDLIIRRDSSTSAAGAGAIKNESYGTYTYQYWPTTSYLNGFKNPGWKLQRARGLNCATSMGAAHYKVTVKTDGAYRIAGYSGAHVPSQERMYAARGSMGTVRQPTQGVNDPSLSEAQSRAAGKFYTKLSKAKSDLKGLVAVGEARETFNLMKSLSEKSVGRLLDYVAKLRKAKRKTKRLQDRKKALADNWLEAQFGIIPLASDMASLYGTLTRENRIWVPVKAEASVTGEPVLGGTSQGIGLMTWNVSTSSVVSRSVKYFAIVRRRDNTWTGYKPSDFGFSIADFVPSVYNLLPYTFLLDYFTNIGQIVNAWSYSVFDAPVSTYTERRSHKFAAVTNNLRATGFDFVSKVESPASYQYEYNTTTRVTGVIPPVPGFSLHLLSTDERRRMVQVGNLSALVASRAFKYWP